ncbi:hypothetical protein BaRGS_00029533 [Batillaria attramentaria]|uniref:RING-type domain-containing protein n=1 Tax=Batillaria attramentaria TaxID=370345 RepID=A0ABD0JWX2_9CAEN
MSLSLWLQIINTVVLSVESNQLEHQLFSDSKTESSIENESRMSTVTCLIRPIRIHCICPFVIHARVGVKMASGGAVDSRVVCSVCLEPYKGRQPKLLPCFHTFCLPCLTALEQRASRQQKEVYNPTGEASNGSIEKKDCTPVSIVCPTCRKVIPVPPAGVTEFQVSKCLEKILVFLGSRQQAFLVDVQVGSSAVFVTDVVYGVCKTEKRNFSEYVKITTSFKCM